MCEDRARIEKILEERRKLKAIDLEKERVYQETLKDNPKLRYLFFELTGACNMECIHCGSNCGRGKREYIDTELMMKCLETVAKDFNPKSLMICLTGGEPMLHPDFHRIIDKINELGFGWGITTNGTLIDRASAAKFKERKLESITMSIDGLEKTHDWFRQTKGSYKRTLDAIRYLQELNIPVEITTVVHKKNFDELEEIYQTMLDLRIDSWKVANMEPIGRAKQIPNLLLSAVEFEILILFLREKRRANKNDMEINFGCSHYLGLDYEREVRDHCFRCGAGTTVASILTNGDIYACLDIERRPELVQGNIRADRFSKVWSEGFKTFRTDRTVSSEYCRDCEERDFCKGDSTHTWNFDKNEPNFCMKRGKVE